MSKFTVDYFQNLYDNKTKNLEETLSLIISEVDTKLDSTFNSEILNIYDKKLFKTNFSLRFDEVQIINSVSLLGQDLYRKEIEKKLKSYNNNVVTLRLISVLLDENIRNENYLDLDFNLEVELPVMRTNKNI